jgi:hypothetical protein
MFFLKLLPGYIAKNSQAETYTKKQKKRHEEFILAGKILIPIGALLLFIAVR